MASKYTYKKINVKNIGIDPFSPVVVKIGEDKYGAVLYRWYNYIVVYTLTSKSNVNNIEKLVGKQSVKNREKIFDKFKKGELPNKVNVYKYKKGEYYTTNYVKDKFEIKDLVNLKVWHINKD